MMCKENWFLFSVALRTLLLSPLEQKYNVVITIEILLDQKLYIS